MRYILLTLLLIGFTACGSGGSKTPANTSEEITTPVSPTPKDSTKKPPSLPTI